MKYKQPSIVSGKSVQDIINMDSTEFNNLNASDLRKVVGRLVSAGNKRLRRFEKAGESSPATRKIESSGGKFSTKGKNLNELRKEFARAKDFLESKTSTRTGWKKVKKEIIEGMKKQGVNMSDIQFDRVWQAYENLKELSPDVANRNLKYIVLKDIADATTDSKLSADEIAQKIYDNLAKAYEEKTAADNGESVSDFFDIE